jgi:hypothetical protein
MIQNDLYNDIGLMQMGYLVLTFAKGKAIEEKIKGRKGTKPYAY